MRLLHIDSSILGTESVSRQLTAAIVGQLLKTGARIDVTYLDLVTTPPPHMTLASLPGAHPLSAKAAPLDSAAQSVRDQSQHLLDEFLAADTVVLGVPMYNFSIPTQLKSWLDIIIVPGKTFRFTEAGPQGLVGDKRVIVAVARGGYYGPHTSAVSAEHAESYMRHVLGFIGVNDPEFIIAEGLATGQGDKTKALESALEAVKQLTVSRSRLSRMNGGSSRQKIFLDQPDSEAFLN
jgi:FMN-dependent NADH-azoreductase